jgi:aromatic ring hydroxylase
VVRGARVLATLAPFADEIAVYPGAAAAAGLGCLCALLLHPDGHAGLKFLCRDSVSSGGNRFDHPLSSRFDEQDAFVIFDDVEVPRDRLFIDCNLKSYNTVMTTSWTANAYQQTMIRASVKLDFAWGVALRMAASINAADSETMRLIGEIWSYAELTRLAVIAAEAEAVEWPSGLWTCAAGPLHVLRGILPIWFPRVNEILRLIGSHNVFSHADRGADGRQGAAAADRPLPAGRQGHGGRGAHPHLPAGLGLRRQRAGQPQRAVRALLPGIIGPQHGAPSRLHRPQPGRPFG